MMPNTRAARNPTPLPPKTHCSIMPMKVPKPPSGVKLSCIEFTLPVVNSVVTAANESALRDPEADLLALHVAAGLVRSRLMSQCQLSPTAACRPAPKQQRSART